MLRREGHGIFAGSHRTRLGSLTGCRRRFSRERLTLAEAPSHMKTDCILEVKVARMMDYLELVSCLRPTVYSPSRRWFDEGGPRFGRLWIVFLMTHHGMGDSEGDIPFYIRLLITNLHSN
jgi:hypothetical protein